MILTQCPDDGVVSIALDYISRGWPIIPLHHPTQSGNCSCNDIKCRSIGKHPRTRWGLKDASTAQDQVISWWNQFPKSNIGIVTGIESNLLVVDIDPRNGGLISLEKLRKRNLLSDTMTVVTGGDGYHFYFIRPRIEKVPSRSNVMPGVDIKCDGGYIVAPGSLHKFGRLYAWKGSKRQPAPLPSGLMSLVVEKTRKSKAPHNVLYTKRIQEGARNTTLTKIAGYFKYIGMEQHLISEGLHALNSIFCIPNLPETEVEKICKSISRYEDRSWEDPKPIEFGMPQGPQFEERHLHGTIRSWVLDTAERLGCPLSFVIEPFLVGISGVIGRSFRVYPRAYDDWTVTPNLWGTIVAPPGTRKSPAINAALKPIRLHSSNLEKRDKNLRLITSDATIEKLLVLMIANPMGMLLIRDELSGWLQMMHRSGREGEREFYLEAWNGNHPYTMDRIGRESVFVDATCLSVFGAIQPENLAGLNSQQQDGLIQRFQFLIVGCQDSFASEQIDRIPDEESFKAVFEKIGKFFEPRIGTGGFPRNIRFDSESVKFFRSWEKTNSSDLVKFISSHPNLVYHLAKYSSLLPSIALVYQLLTDFESTEVGIESVEAADEVCQILKQHAEIFYQEILQRAPKNPTHVMVKKIKEGRIRDGVSPREVYRRGWKGLDTAGNFTEAQEYLESKHWVRLETISTGSKRREVLRINPKLGV